MTIRLKIKKMLPGVKENVSLSKHTTFKIGGPAKYFYEAKSEKNIINAVRAARQLRLPFFILGRGSNLLVADKGYDGLVIKMRNEKIRIKGSTIFVEAGMGLNELISCSFKKGLTGMEWASGIPGTLGGAICGNAGAFGFSISDSIKKVRVLDVSGVEMKTREFKNSDCGFDYRNSIFKKNQKLLILSAELKLEKGIKKEIGKIIKNNFKKRKKNQPNESSAGSVFKNQKSKIKNKKIFKENSEKSAIPTAVLIEKCGLKGKKIGDAQVSKVHANFIVNLGKAKSSDVKKLIDLIKEKIKNKLKIKLEEEIKYIGFK